MELSDTFLEQVALAMEGTEEYLWNQEADKFADLHGIPKQTVDTWVLHLEIANKESEISLHDFLRILEKRRNLQTCIASYSPGCTFGIPKHVVSGWLEAWIYDGTINPHSEQLFLPDNIIELKCMEYRGNVQIPRTAMDFSSAEVVSVTKIYNQKIIQSRKQFESRDISTFSPINRFKVMNQFTTGAGVMKDFMTQPMLQKDYEDRFVCSLNEECFFAE